MKTIKETNEEFQDVMKEITENIDEYKKEVNGPNADIGDNQYYTAREMVFESGKWILHNLGEIPLNEAPKDFVEGMYDALLDLSEIVLKVLEDLEGNPTEEIDNILGKDIS